MHNNINGIFVTNVNYLETSRGVAYTAHIFMIVHENQNLVGIIENRGDGGMTSIYIEPEHRETFNNRMYDYFRTIGTAIHEDERDYEVFADHLLDMYEHGRVLTDAEKWALIQGE